MFYVVTIFGAAWVAICSYFILLSKRGANWPGAIGTILSSEVEMTIEKSDPLSKGDVYGGRRFNLIIKYEYSAGGNKYQSSRLSYSGEGVYFTPEDAKREQAKFPVGQQVEVYYNPAEPGTAVLKVGNMTRLCLALVFGIIILGVGIAGIAGII